MIMKIHLFLIVFFKLISISSSIGFTNQCTQYCSCDLSKKKGTGTEPKLKIHTWQLQTVSELEF